MPKLQKYLFCTTVILVLSLLSCSKENSETELITNPFKVYKISKGQHFSEHTIFKEITGLKAMSFTVIFDSTAKYTSINPQNQFDINKLYGFADNNKFHHVFSARIGWRWVSNQLELLGYVYNDSILKFAPIGFFPLNTELPCKIEVAKNKYLFRVNNILAELPRTTLDSTANGYQLYPYFGGDETAPHDIYIRIKDH
ncbi:MAG: hypothetical protein KGZ59_11825 [Chitinophagaceae bacterium]|nr:hypothetical protein [Chitinophagaceae bacterium]